MRIDLPATISARVTDRGYEKDFGYDLDWLEVTLFFGDTPVKIWRLEPKDVPTKSLSLLNDDGEYGREELEQFVASKLAELFKD